MNEEINRVIEFTDFNNFWSNYKPFTPYGRDHKRKMFFFHNEKELNQEYKSISEFLKYIKEDSFNSDRVEYHLKKIPEIETLKNDNFDTTTIFMIKKFLINYKQVINLLNKDIIKSLDLKFELENLLEYLSLGQSKKETFHLSSQYNPKLAILRNKIFDYEKKLQNTKKSHLELIKDKLDLDFRFNSFLVMSEDKAINLDKNLVFLEPYDSKKMIAKPILPKEYYSLKKEMDNYLDDELKIQKSVINKIGSEILGKKDDFIKYIETVRKIDIYISRARIALKYNMTKPLLSGDNKIIINNGCLLPLKEKSENTEIVYYPLNIEFDTRINVINGSNMGGKTVLLKTIGFLQILAQLGFFVPAKKYQTKIFEHIFYIGNLENNPVEGLSSFGLEINALVECFKINKGNVLYLLDEFARTTNSLEAKALLQSVLQEFSQRLESTSFVSTHFVELTRQNDIGYYHMKGLDYQEYLKYYQKDLNYSLHDRIILINRFMRYEVEKTENMITSYDALKIAETLGLDKHIIDKAKSYLVQNDLK